MGNTLKFFWEVVPTFVPTATYKKIPNGVSVGVRGGGVGKEGREIGRRAM